MGKRNTEKWIKTGQAICKEHPRKDITGREFYELLIKVKVNGEYPPGICDAIMDAFDFGVAVGASITEK